jgi:hypothetical protein
MTEVAVGTTEDNDGRQVATKAGWKRNAVHTIVLHSGTVVKVRIPDLAKMIEVGTIPQNLMDSALGMASNPSMADKPGRELMATQREFTDLVTLHTVVEPKLTEEDVADIPYEDKEMLVEIATRNRNLDAEGSHISGLDKSEKYRRFHRIGEFSTPVEDL